MLPLYLNRVPKVANKALKHKKCLQCINKYLMVPLKHTNMQIESGKIDNESLWGKVCQKKQKTLHLLAEENDQDRQTNLPRERVLVLC